MDYKAEDTEIVTTLGLPEKEFFNILLGKQKAIVLIENDPALNGMVISEMDEIRVVWDSGGGNYFSLRCTVTYVEMVELFSILSIDNIKTVVRVSCYAPAYCPNHSRITKICEKGTVGKIQGIEETIKFLKGEDCKIKWEGRKYAYLTTYGNHIKISSIFDI